MVLDKKETTVAYRCPVCGASVMSMVGIFALTADMIRLKCPCGCSTLELVYTKDKKVRLNVPCFLCPTPHSYLISAQLFFDRELFTLPCSYSGIDICFIGKQNKVAEAMEKSEKELHEMLGDTSFEELTENTGKESIELTDPQVLDIIMYVVRELADEGAISCGCEDDGDYNVEIHDDHVTLSCSKCGRSLDIPISSLSAANDFLGCDKIELK